MRFSLLFCLIFSWVNAGSRAGTITGVVHAEGKPGATPTADAGRYDSRKYKFLERMNYDEVHDFIVYVDGVTNRVEPGRVVKRVLTQKDATFRPHVLPVAAGTVVEWPNEDEIFHNVFSMSESNPFDLGLYKKEDQAKRIEFDNPGRVDVFCSIHANMYCVILVLPNPMFAATDSKGHYAIKDLHAGTYKLKAWHERLPAQTKEITVSETGDVTVNFTLGITGLPKY